MEKTTLATPTGESYFDGNGFGFLGWGLLGVLVTICTLFLCAPLAFVWIYHYETNHTVISGRRLHFEGKAMSLFGHWIKWLLLTVITCGIYSFWLQKRLKQWKAKNTSVEGMIEDYKKEGDYTGSVIGFPLYCFGLLLLTIITLGIFAPWRVAKIARYEAVHTSYHGLHMAFDGSGGSYFLTWLKAVLLSLITCGIYTLVMLPKKRWTTKHTSFTM